MIKNIVFDVGNVLLTFAPAKFIERFVDDSKDQQLLLREMFQSVEWIQYDRGTLLEEELGRRICARIPQRLHETVLEIVNSWHEELQPITEMEPVLNQLKENGYQLYILSNAPGAYYEFRNKIPAIHQFDGAFVSADWKLLKPEVAIFRTFCTHFQLVPSQCYFVDDLPPNIEGAINAGMNGCVFRGDTQELLQNFERAGIRYSK